MPGATSMCRLGASQRSLIVTEWPAAEKANLEAIAQNGAVAVELSGCAMRLVPDCKLPGEYYWQRTTTSSDVLEIASESDLYTKLPLGALALEGELKRSGTLYVETTVGGQVRLDGMDAAHVPSTPECARATHVIDGVSLGAFVLKASAASSASGKVGFRGLGAGGSTSTQARVVRASGRAEACGSDVEGVPLDCGSPIQVFVSPIPGRAEPEGPPGTIRVDFVSASASTRWDVYLDDQATCTTPCARWVDPSRGVAMRSRDASDRVRLSSLDSNSGPLQVVAQPTQRGRLATGITFTALGGLAVVTGIVLTSVGCSDEDQDKMCTAGVITGLAGIPVTLASIWFLRSALPKVRARPVFSIGRVGQATGGWVTSEF